MDTVNDESVWWTKSLRLLDTHSLRAFIIKSIHSFIICILVTMWGETKSMTDRWLVSCHSSLLRVLLSSGPYWFLLSALVPFWSSSWVSITTFFWCNCSSRTWFYLVRRSTAAMRVWTCLSRAVGRGSSPWLLVVVAINRVSTMQLLSGKRWIWLISWSCSP